VIRDVARLQVLAHARRVLSRSDRRVAAIIASSPEAVLRGWRRVGPTVYYATDDFVAGASILGASHRHTSRARASNLRSADAVLAVTEALAETLRR
jgi:teichuronic acid biosynthesis glycosyltransferase TuaH